ncbi:hypothetical protein CSKR_103451 [Clonorchis sinensis]|uniref:Potassium channel domain-containing protein n=1 Tax=Clonorchis sinensis TaxID=79923 RepID=A0A419PIW7_CLOSI|nr:hypothetical protein CSKR_103451 [Clonorchis sinensis]
MPFLEDGKTVRTNSNKHQTVSERPNEYTKRKINIRLIAFKENRRISYCRVLINAQQRKNYLDKLQEARLYDLAKTGPLKDHGTKEGIACDSENDFNSRKPTAVNLALRANRRVQNIARAGLDIRPLSRKTYIALPIRGSTSKQKGDLMALFNVEGIIMRMRVNRVCNSEIDLKQSETISALTLKKTFERVVFQRKRIVTFSLYTLRTRFKEVTRVEKMLNHLPTGKNLCLLKCVFLTYIPQAASETVKKHVSSIAYPNKHIFSVLMPVKEKTNNFSIEKCSCFVSNLFLFLLSTNVLSSHTGYGYTTPKTAQGKILTIFYALIGIPLVVLYLSNIGDYLADVFRALYSRTCRNTCENYCSISLFTSVVRSLVRRYYGKPVEDEIPNDEMIHIDGVAEGGNVPFRRRKRVLLKAFSLTDEECPNNESDLEANELSFTGVQKDPNHIQQTAETRPTPKTRCGPNFERLRILFEEIGVYRIVHSPRLVSVLNVSIKHRGSAALLLLVLESNNVIKGNIFDLIIPETFLIVPGIFTVVHYIRVVIRPASNGNYRI